MQKLLLILFVLCSIIGYAQNTISDKVDSLKSRLDLELNEEDRIVTLNQLAIILLREDTVSSVKYGEEALSLSQEIGFVDGEVEALNFFARHYTEQGKLDTAIFLLDQLVVLEDQTNDKKFIANAYVSKGNIYDISGRYTEALSAYLEAERIYYESGNLRGVGMANLGIGNIYNTTERFTESIIRYRKSTNLLSDLNDPYASWPMNNMAASMEALGMYDSAEYFFLKSLELKEELGDSYGASYTYSDIAELYVKKGEIKKAERSLLKALQMKLQVEGMSKETIAMALIRLGEVRQLSSKPHLALQNFQEALTYAEQSASIEAIMMAHQHLSNAYFEASNYKLAYQSLHIFSELKDSVNRIKSSQTLAEVQTKYETKEKDQQLKMISNQNQVNILKAEKAEEATKRSETMFFAAIIIVGLLLLVVVFAYRSIRQRKKNNAILVKKNDEILLQKEIVEEKSREILDSITYAKRIQSAILPPIADIRSALPQSFVLYKPKDIVAGDFYWMEKIGDTVLFAAADCTGHGVPGAMVSVVCNNGLNQSVREYNLTEPGEILDKTKEIVIQEFEKSVEEVKDGMDIALCSLFKSNDDLYLLKYAGAHNPLWVIKKGSSEITEVKANKQPIGKYVGSENYQTTVMNLNRGDMIYVFSDGYADQFGGEKGKKFKTSNFKKLLLSIKDEPVENQLNLLDQQFESWKGTFDQLDDICIIGVRI